MEDKDKKVTSEQSDANQKPQNIPAGPGEPHAKEGHHLHMPNLHVAETLHRVEHASMDALHRAEHAAAHATVEALHKVEHAGAAAGHAVSRMLHVVSALHLDRTFEALKQKHVPVHKHSLWYYAGGLALMFFGIQVATGILLLFYYDPTASGAHKSVELIMNVVPYGHIIRSVHSWSANALVLTIFVHMFSTFLMESYRTPREIMWLSGVLLLLLIMGFGFSGYLLPWDQTAYFATKIGTEVPRSLPYMGDFVSYFMKGGEDVSSATLTRMFALHVGVLPVLSLVLVFIHTTLTLLFGSSVPPNARVTGSTKFFPDYVLKEAVVWLVGFAILITVAILYPWELGAAYDIQNPTEPPAGVHPEWYFMFLFQTLKLIPEWLAIVLLNVVLIFWMFVPYLDRRAQHQKKSPIFRWIGIAAIAYIVVTTTFAYIAVADEKAQAKKEQAQVGGTTEPAATPAPTTEGGTGAK